jgi:hypothetical protein
MSQIKDAVWPAGTRVRLSPGVKRRPPVDIGVVEAEFGPMGARVRHDDGDTYNWAWSELHRVIPPFEVGKTYRRTQGGDPVTIIGGTGDKGYETVFCADNVHRYNRESDRGRVTASAFDMSDPLNLAPLWQLPAAPEGFRASARLFHKDEGEPWGRAECVLHWVPVEMAPSLVAGLPGHLPIPWPFADDAVTTINELETLGFTVEP